MKQFGNATVFEYLVIKKTEVFFIRRLIELHEIVYLQTETKLNFQLISKSIELLSF